MTQIDYGRLNALEAVLGGRAAIQAMYEAHQTFSGGSGSSAGVHITHKFPFAFDTLRDAAQFPRDTIVTFCSSATWPIRCAINACPPSW